MKRGDLVTIGYAAIDNVDGILLESRPGGWWLYRTDEPGSIYDGMEVLAAEEFIVPRGEEPPTHPFHRNFRRR